MSNIIKALQKAQRKFTANAAEALVNNETYDKDHPSLRHEPAEIKEEQGEKASASSTAVNIGVSLALMGAIGGVGYFLNNRITSGINGTSAQMGDMLDSIKRQEERISMLYEEVQKIEAASNAQNKETTSRFDTINSDINAKVGSLKGEINNQKSVWDSAINEQGKTTAKNREMLETYQAENIKLKEQVDLLKDKVDAIINIPTTP